MNIINDYKQLRIIESLNATTKLAKENKKLKEKLEKIKEFLVNTCVICGQKDTSKCESCGCTKIMDIIEGVEDDRI